MNTSDPVTLAERLRVLHTGRLCVRLQHARAEYAAAVSYLGRAYWSEQINAIEAELKSRGELPA